MAVEGHPFPHKERYEFRPLTLRLSHASIPFFLIGTPVVIATDAVPQDGAAAGILLAGLIAMGLGIRRSFRIGIAVDQQGIAIQNYWRRYDLSWDELSEVTVTWETFGIHPAPVIGFRTYGSSRVRGAQATGVWNRRKLEFIGRLMSRPEMKTVVVDLPYGVRSARPFHWGVFRR